MEIPPGPEQVMSDASPNKPTESLEEKIEEKITYRLASRGHFSRNTAGRTPLRDYAHRGHAPDFRPPKLATVKAQQGATIYRQRDVGVQDGLAGGHEQHLACCNGQA
jgi:hypothetical protein